MAEKKQDTHLTNEQAAEVFRQIRKRDEFHVKALDALQTAIEAESTTKQIRENLEKITKERDEKLDSYNKAVEARKAELDAKLTDLKQKHNHDIDELQTQLNAVNQEKQNSQAEVVALKEQIGDLKAQRKQAETELETTRKQLAQEIKNYQANTQRTKDKLERDLETLQGTIKTRWSDYQELDDKMKQLAKERGWDKP
jgi:chromosome segregation ATPase